MLYLIFAPIRGVPGSVKICNGVFLIEKHDWKALLTDLKVIESRISVCKALETSQRYIRIQIFVWVLKLAVASTVDDPIKYTDIFWNGKVLRSFTYNNLALFKLNYQSHRYKQFA